MPSPIAAKPSAELAEQFATALKAAGQTQSGFARLLAEYRTDIDVLSHARRVRGWAQGRAPADAAALLALDLLAKAR